MDTLENERTSIKLCRTLRAATICYLLLQSHRIKSELQNHIFEPFNGSKGVHRVFFNTERSHDKNMSVFVLLLRATSGGCEVRRGNIFGKDSHGSEIIEVIETRQIKFLKYRKVNVLAS